MGFVAISSGFHGLIYGSLMARGELAIGFQACRITGLKNNYSL